jgi:hypothetical protein
MGITERAWSDGLASSDAPEQQLDSTAELARLYASWRGQRSTVEGLREALAVTRRDAATLKTENAALRAQLAASRRAASGTRPGPSAGSDTGMRRVRESMATLRQERNATRPSALGHAGETATETRTG